MVASRSSRSGFLLRVSSVLHAGELALAFVRVQLRLDATLCARLRFSHLHAQAYVRCSAEPSRKKSRTADQNVKSATPPACCVGSETLERYGLHVAAMGPVLMPERVPRFVLILKAPGPQCFSRIWADVESRPVSPWPAWSLQSRKVAGKTDQSCVTNP